MNERFKHYVLGHNKIDEEHFKIFALMEEVKISSKACDLESLAKMLFAIQIEIEFHFAHEETLMEQIEYPYLEYHVNVHREIQKNMAVAFIKYKEDRYDAHEKLVKCLEENIIQHADSLDRQIVEFINKSQTGD
jgi:hemerythrin-like metal-binding protein